MITQRPGGSARLGLHSLGVILPKCGGVRLSSQGKQMSLSSMPQETSALELAVTISLGRAGCSKAGDSANSTKPRPAVWTETKTGPYRTADEIFQSNHLRTCPVDLIKEYTGTPHAGSTNWLRFSFVGGKRKKSRKLRSPACPASGPKHKVQIPALDSALLERFGPLTNSGRLASLLNRNPCMPNDLPPGNRKAM